MPEARLRWNEPWPSWTTSGDSNQGASYEVRGGRAMTIVPVSVGQGQAAPLYLLLEPRRQESHGRGQRLIQPGPEHGQERAGRARAGGNARAWPASSLGLRGNITLSRTVTSSRIIVTVKS